jgi:hypothetical protein
MYAGSLAGSVVAVNSSSSNNTVLEFEIPDQYGAKARYTSDMGSGASPSDYTCQVSASLNSAGSTSTYIADQFYSAADDRNFYVYHGPPILYFNTTNLTV